MLAKPEPESAVAKMQLDSQKRDLDEHIDTVSQSTVDTMQTYGELSIEDVTDIEYAKKKVMDLVVEYCSNIITFYNNILEDVVSKTL